ncbi:hypothetical protein CBS101457_004627 [Exobasidium rhododendri]|nr:hypothetical protein CBS101457_004627 [Exobasidium rhododendri]
MSISRTSARALISRPAVLLLPYAPPAAPPLPGPIRWSSSQAGQLILTDQDNESTIYRKADSSTVNDNDRKGKSKAEARGTATRRIERIKELLRTSQEGIEESQRRKDVDARYPGLKAGQTNFMAVLLEMTELCKTIEVGGLSAQELHYIHTGLDSADRENARRSTDNRGRRYQKSSATYAMLLKYAYKRRDAAALRTITKEGLTWKHHQDRSVPARIEKKSRFIHPRVAAADDLSRLARNLFVSLKVKHKQEVSKGTETFLPGKQLPSSKSKVMQGDDAIALSTLLQNRLGTFKFGKGEGDEEYLKLSRPAQLSRYPLTHQSRRIRWVNRLVERGLLEKLAEKDFSSDLKTIVSTRSKAPSSQRTKIGISLEESDTEVNKMMDLLTESTKGSQQILQLQALQDAYNKWQEELATRLRNRKNVARVLKQFHSTADTATKNKVEHISQVVPTWLVLSSLRMQIYVGDGVKAEKMVEYYLESLQRAHGDRLLSDIIPVSKDRVHAVTDPLSPPIGSSLLNGILRAHATGAAQDCFENMLQSVERWSIGGYKLCSSVTLRKTIVSKVNVGECLVPDVQTISIMLESLRMRRKRLALGIKLVEEMWKRWAIATIDLEEGKHASATVATTKKCQTMSLSLRTFTTLLTWAVIDGKVEKVNKIFSMMEQWRREHFRSIEEWNDATPEERISWERAKKKAEGLKSKESRKEGARGADGGKDGMESEIIA